MWMIKNFVGGLTWICRDKQEHEKINVEIEFKWDVVCYHCQNEIPGNISRRVKMVTYTDSSSAYSSSDMVQKLWRGEWLSRHWDQESEESVLLLVSASWLLYPSLLPPQHIRQQHPASPGQARAQAALDSFTPRGKYDDTHTAIFPESIHNVCM